MAGYAKEKNINHLKDMSFTTQFYHPGIICSKWMNKDFFGKQHYFNCSDASLDSFNRKTHRVQRRRSTAYIFKQAMRFKLNFALPGNSWLPDAKGFKSLN